MVRKRQDFLSMEAIVGFPEAFWRDALEEEMKF